MATLKRTHRIGNPDAGTFRTWAQDVHDALAAAGWVQTTDASQINLATVVAPGSSSQSMGYEIWRMADGLQATAPIFLKVEYGSGTEGAAAAGIFWTVGTGSDGAGNLTGKLSGRVLMTADDSGGAATDTYFSGDPSRFAMCWARPGAYNSPNTSALFSIERTKDSAGADTNEGYLFYEVDDAWSVGMRICAGAILFGVSSPQAVTVGVGNAGSAIGPPMNVAQLAANDGTNAGVFPISLPGRRGSENPGMNQLAYWDNDYATFSLPTVTIYGADHTYVCLAGGWNMGFGTPRDGGQKIMMRYE